MKSINTTSPTDLNSVAANLYAEIRHTTDSPAEGMGALTMCMYVLWKECRSTNANLINYELHLFADEVAASLRELHLLNDVKGEA